MSDRYGEKGRGNMPDYPDTATETPHGFTLDDEEGRSLTFDRAGFIYAPDPDNAQGYALNADEARYLAAALVAFAEDKEAEQR